MMEVGEHDTLVGGGKRQQSCVQRFKFPIIAAAVLLAALGIVLAVVVSAKTKDNNKPWEELIQVSKIMDHLQQLQNIANANNNNRAASTSGYNMSVEYVVEQLTKHTDYNITVQHFSYPTTEIVQGPTVIVANEAHQMPLVYGIGQDYLFMGSFYGTYELNATVSHVGEFGCESSDYDDVETGTVFVIKRGLCNFVIKVNLAVTKTPVAIVIYNDGAAPDRMGPFNGALGAVSIPVLGTSLNVGMLTFACSTYMSMLFQIEIGVAYTMNVIADTKVGRPDRVVVVGSHLDSVPAGPGINDNGSGSALNLELAIQLASDVRQKKIKNKIRFCWFGGEELGLLGSTFYVSNLNQTDLVELSNIAVNLNFDMIGSPNFIRGIYNGSDDEYDFVGNSANGSALVQNIFNDYYASQNITVAPTAYTGRSDYGPFLGAGIPAGGLFTGAEEEKSMEERTLFGGFAGASLDPCYHLSCDTIENINQDVLGDMAKGAAHVVEKLATEEDLRLYLNTKGALQG